jgi:HEAT repeat protein
VNILVTAFDNFAREWSFYLPEEVYDEQGFRIRISNEARFSVNPENELKRTEEIIREFHEDHVKFYQEDLVDLIVRPKEDDPQLRQDVMGWLYKFLSGKVEGRPDVKGVTPHFVGHTLSKVIDAAGDQEMRIKIRNVLNGDLQEPGEIKRGACYVAAYYRLEMGEIELDQSAIGLALGDGNVIVRLAACYAAGRIGTAETAKQLVGKVRDQDVMVRRWAARAIGRIAAAGPGNADLIRQDSLIMEGLGERIWYEHPDDDPNKPNPNRDPVNAVREEICSAFGHIKGLEGLKYLIRARRDMDDTVRFAASRAVSQIATDASAVKILWELYDPPEEEDPKFSDREGAILALGDAGGNARDRVPALCEKLVGSGNEPWKVWEPHQRVRRAIALALGDIGHKSPRVRDTLVKALSDPAEEVRAAAYQGLNKLVDGGLQGVTQDVPFQGGVARVNFMAKLPKDVRAGFVSSISSWLTGQGSSIFTDAD